MDDLLKGIGIFFGSIGIGFCLLITAIGMRGCEDTQLNRPAIGFDGYIISTKGVPCQPR